MDYKYMDIAFNEAKKAFDLNEVPVGAVIVKNGVVLAKGYNMKEMKKSCIKHAEIIAIEKASKKLDNWRLNDCDIYLTLDPCPMCASAIKQARIKNVYSACLNSDNNTTSIIKKIFMSDDINPRVNYFTNIDIKRSNELLNAFFTIRRNK